MYGRRCILCRPGSWRGVGICQPTGSGPCVMSGWFWRNGVVYVLSMLQVHADVYNSAIELGSVLQLEQRAVGMVMDLLEINHDNELQRFVDDSRSVDTEEGNIINPIDVYHLLRRLTVDFNPVIHAVMASRRLDFVARLSRLTRADLFPNSTDLDAAALALVRLQSVYNLTAGDLRLGQVRGHQAAWNLSATDCLRLSQQGFVHLEFDSAELWNRVAHAQTDSCEMLRRLDLKLSQMQLYRRMVVSMAQTVPDRFLHGFSGSGVPLGLLGDVLVDAEPDDSWRMKTIEDRYKRLCRGQDVFADADSRQFSCLLAHADDPYYRWSSVKLELISPRPLIVRYHEVVSVASRRRIALLGSSCLQTSRVTGNTGRLGRVTHGRVAKSCFVKRAEPLIEKLHRQVEALTSLSTEFAEDLQVVNYGIGGHYEPHVDFFSSYDDGDFSPPRDRIATFLFYLSDVAAGGATVFPSIGVAVEPIAGSAVLWYNLHPSGRSDYLTVHASCPVLLGSKTIANFWLHESGQEFHRKCGLREDD